MNDDENKMENAIDTLIEICSKYDCRIEDCPLEKYCGENICVWYEYEKEVLQ